MQRIAHPRAGTLTLTCRDALQRTVFDRLSRGLCYSRVFFNDRQFLVCFVGKLAGRRKQLSHWDSAPEGVRDSCLIGRELFSAISGGVFLRSVEGPFCGR